MRKSEAVSYFGTQKKLADALGIQQGSVSGWDDLIPMARAIQIERVTGGRLKADLSVYKGSGRRTSSGRHL